MIEKLLLVVREHEKSCEAYCRYTEAKGTTEELYYAQGKVDGVEDLAHDIRRTYIDETSPIHLISAWALRLNLIGGSTPKDQCLKLVQEVGELSDSLCKGKSPIDDIGDCIVVLNNIAMQHNLTLDQCILHAYEDIKDRKGEMRDGVFIKEADLKKEV